MFIFYKGKLNIWRYRSIILLIWWTSFILMIISSILLLPFMIISLFSSDLSENVYKQESVFMFLCIFFGLQIFLINSILIFLTENTQLIMLAKTKKSMLLHSALLKMNKRFIFIKRTSKINKQEIISESKNIFNDWCYDQWKTNFPEIHKRIDLLGINWISYSWLNLIVVSYFAFTSLIERQTALITYLCLFAIFFICHYIWLSISSTKAYKANAINKKSWIISLIPLVNLLAFHSSLLKD